MSCSCVDLHTKQGSSCRSSCIIIGMRVSDRRSGSPTRATLPSRQPWTHLYTHSRMTFDLFVRQAGGWLSRHPGHLLSCLADLRAGHELEIAGLRQHAFLQPYESIPNERRLETYHQSPADATSVLRRESVAGLGACRPQCHGSSHQYD